MVGLFEAIVLGIVQGLTEWLPVSSSGHLVLAQEMLGIEASVFFDLVLHLGTLAVITFFYRDDILKIARSLLSLDFASEHGRLALFVVIGSIPIGLAGVLIKDHVEDIFSSMLFVGIALMITGLVVLSTRNRGGKKDIGAKDSAFIGIAQAFAILPGISRSGSTISAALNLGIDREKAARFSFLLSIPAIVGATLLMLIERPEIAEPLPALAAGFLTSMAVGYWSLVFLVDIIKKERFHLFSYYCFALGAFAIAYSIIIG